MGSAAIMGGATIAGSLIGARESKKQREAAVGMQRDAAARLASVPEPDIEDQELRLPEYQFLGEYDPTLEEAIAMGDTAYEDISVGPETKDAQMMALEQLTRMGEEPLTDIEQAQLNEIRRDIAGQEQSRQEAILSSMAQRGMGGSGAELAARLSSSQQASDRASQEGDRLAAMAQQRALQAISGAGSMAGNIRSQEFGEQESLARARDAVQRFNTANQRGVLQRNVGAQNVSGQDAQQQRQRIAEQNVAQREAEQRHNKSLLQQQFDNRLRKAGQVAQGQQAMASTLMQQAPAAAKAYSQMGAGVGQALGGIYSAYNKSEGGGASEPYAYNYNPDPTKTIG